MAIVSTYRWLINNTSAEHAAQYLDMASWETGDENGFHYLDCGGVALKYRALHSELGRKPSNTLKVVDIDFTILDSDFDYSKLTPSGGPYLLSIEFTTLGNGKTAVRARVWEDNLPHTGEIIERVRWLLSQEYAVIDEVPEPTLTHSTEQSHEPDPRLAILDDRQQTIVRLRHQEYKAREIADQMKKSVSFVYNEASKIRKILIAEYGEEVADELSPKLR